MTILDNVRILMTEIVKILEKYKDMGITDEKPKVQSNALITRTSILARSLTRNLQELRTQEIVSDRWRGNDCGKYSVTGSKSHNAVSVLDVYGRG